MKNFLTLIVTCLVFGMPSASHAATGNLAAVPATNTAAATGKFIFGAPDGSNTWGIYGSNVAALLSASTLPNRLAPHTTADAITNALAILRTNLNNAIYGSINLNRLPFTKRQLESNGVPWTVCLLGDSVGYVKMEEMYPWLYQLNGSNGFVSGAFSTFGVHTVGATNILTLGTSNGTNWFKTYYHVGNNDSIVWTNIHGPTIYANRFEVAYLRGPTAGGFKIQTSTNGAAYVDALTVDAYAASAWRGELTNISVLPGLWNFRVVGISNTPSSILFGGAFVTNGSGIRIVDFVHSATSFEDYLQVNTNVTYPIMQQLRVNTVTIEEKSTATNRWTNQALMDRWITNTMPNADRIYVGTTPDVFGNHREQNSWERSYCLTNGIPWFDGESPVGSYNLMTNYFGADDGVHPTRAAQSFIAAVFMDAIGWSRQTPGTNGSIPNRNGSQRWIGHNNFASAQADYIYTEGANNGVEFRDRADYPATIGARSLWFRLGGAVQLYDYINGTGFRFVSGVGGDLSPGLAGQNLGQNVPWSNFYSSFHYLTRNTIYSSDLVTPASSLTNFTADFQFSDRHFFLTNNLHITTFVNGGAIAAPVYQTLRVENTNATTYTVSAASTFRRAGTNFVRVEQGKVATIQMCNWGANQTNTTLSITLHDSP